MQCVSLTQHINKIEDANRANDNCLSSTKPNDKYKRNMANGIFRIAHLIDQVNQRLKTIVRTRMNKELHLQTAPRDNIERTKHSWTTMSTNRFKVSIKPV